MARLIPGREFLLKLLEWSPAPFPARNLCHAGIVRALSSSNRSSKPIGAVSCHRGSVFDGHTPHRVGPGLIARPGNQSAAFWP